ncbi:MAG: glucosamine 6-phosphate synthetase [Armatimonadota bacterium]
MCGQTGVIYGPKKRQSEEQTYLKWLFIHLLLLSERRGPFATGLAWLKKDGSHCIFKRPMRAVEFVKMKQFVDAIAYVDNSTTWLAGHTRWPTRGSIERIENAHPIRSGYVLGTHNGTIANADELFKEFDLPRFAEVDSEIIFRMTDADMKNGRIDTDVLKSRLALCSGQISAVMASKLDPQIVVVVKGNMPLELRYHPEHRVVVYASDSTYLNTALSREKGWRRIAAKPMSIMTFHIDNLPNFESVPFRLAGVSVANFERFTGR